MLTALKLKLHTKCIIITRKKLNQAIEHGIIKTVDGMSVLLTEQYYQLQSLTGGLPTQSACGVFQLKEAV